jgi:hypothetical protein
MPENDVVLVRWPDEAERLDQLRDQGRPRLLLVQSDAPPPAVDDGLEIAPGDSLTLEPGGTHIMLSGVDPANYPAAVEVTLTFDGADPITFQAPSQAGAPDPMAGMDHSGM